MNEIMTDCINERYCWKMMNWSLNILILKMKLKMRLLCEDRERFAKLRNRRESYIWEYDLWI